jgi:hypothetical protein
VKHSCIAMADDDIAEPRSQIPIAVRGTRTLFRLTPQAHGNLSRASRQEAIVAADSEEEARSIAFLHDPHGNDWGSELFASCVVIDSIGTHVHGDISFISTPVRSPNAARRRRTP